FTVGLPARVKIDQPVDDFWNASCRNLRRQASEQRTALRRAAADHDEILRHRARADAAYAALESDRRDVMLSAAVRAAADLDPRAVGGGDQIGTAAEVIFEEPTESARLRHRQAATLSARAARDVGHAAGVAETEPCRREPRIELPDIAGVHPAEQQ